MLRLLLDVTAHYKRLWTEWQLSDFGRHRFEPSKYCVHHRHFIKTFLFLFSDRALISLHLSQVQVKSMQV